MKKIIKLLSVFMASYLTFSTINIEKIITSANESIIISPYNKFEINNGVFEGWGTSLCWWANRIGYSDSLSQKAADAFYSDNGLRLNIARFNIGGGDDPAHNHITRTDSNMPGYTLYNNGQIYYDWSADSNQRNVLLKSIEACDDSMIIEMFSNSPPFYMTQSGCSSGGIDSGVNNLRDDCYDDFANYLAEVCYHYENEWGVDIQSIDAMNEPYTNYWGAYSNKQEGCHFDQGQSQSDIILELQKSLKSRGLEDILLSGTDETSIDTQINSFYALSENAKAAIERIDTHTYSGSKRSELKDLAINANKNLWMSEVDGGGTAGTNAGEMGAALWLADRITLDVNQLNASAWILWQVIDNHISKNGYNGNKDSGMPNTNGGYWGVAVADHDNDNIILTKKYYAFGQYTRYIRPGMIMLKSSDSTIAAFDPVNKQLVIVALNKSDGYTNMNFELSGFDAYGKSANIIRTSLHENWANAGTVNLDENNLNVSLSPNSVTTYIIDNISYTNKLNNKINIHNTMLSGSDAWKQSDNDFTKAFDEKTSTFFDGVDNGWVQVDLGEVYNIEALGFAPRNGYEYRCPDGMFMSSVDGITWENIYTINYKPFSGMQYITDFNNLNARFIKYQVPDGPPANSYNNDDVYCCNIAEISLYGQKLSDIKIKGDVNKDGYFNIADVVLLQKWILGADKLYDWENADLCQDDLIDIFDLCLMKKHLLNNF